MVLGIDEYLEGEDKNKQLEFIYFKKYFQRIHKETGCLYRKWIEEMKQYNKDDFLKKKKQQPSLIEEDYAKNINHHIYIFGHSLDITDKDILKELICCENTSTTIFYVNRKVYVNQISNLVQVINQKELINRVSEPNKTIIFKQQKEMIKDKQYV